MSKILIIGNILKDVYIKLDDRHTDFETDERGIDWLNLGFNGAAHKFYRRTSVYGGAAVSLSVLAKLGVDAEILNSQSEFQNGEIIWSGEPDNYRYIFSHNGEITYFVPSRRKTTDWSMPKGTPEWILVDRSTTVSSRLVDELKNFLKFSPTTKIAVHMKKIESPDERRLSEMADVLFVEDEPAIHREEKIVDKVELDRPSKQLICHVGPRHIRLSDAEESWCLSKTDMMTHLTVYSTIVATILGVIAVGGSAADAVLWARLNAEEATLEGSLTARKLQELAKAEKSKRDDMKLVAKMLMAPKKGILAMDESDNKLAQRLTKVGIGGVERKRTAWREMILTTPNLRDYLSGIILSEQMSKLRIKRASAAEYVTGCGMIPGIKADLGQGDLKETGETYTIGEDDLVKRLRAAYADGYRFAKWRAVFTIRENEPSFIAVERNAELLASFAKECQLVGIVPMIESDILRDGSYSIEECAAVTDRVLSTVFEKLEQRHVVLDSCILKTNMIMSGSGAETAAPAEAIGMATAAILRHVVPKYLAGVVFLSGGQEAKEAAQSFTAVCQNAPFPWAVSFAFGRALQEPAMLTWKGKDENVKAAQAALKRHLEANVDALRYLR